MIFWGNGEILGASEGRQWPSGSSLLRLALRCLYSSSAQGCSEGWPICMNEFPGVQTPSKSGLPSGIRGVGPEGAGLPLPFCAAGPTGPNFPDFADSSRSDCAALSKGSKAAKPATATANVSGPNFLLVTLPPYFVATSSAEEPTKTLRP